jgi:hypothetical protein
MNISLVSDCPVSRQSIFCWNPVEGNLWVATPPTDPPACGTPLKKGSKEIEPSFCKRGGGDLSESFPKAPSFFLSTLGVDPFISSPAPTPTHSHTLRRPLRVLLIGERQDVLTTIQNLHKRGFADAGDWSIPLPYPQANAVSQFIPWGLSHVVISVHTKYLN